MLNFNIFLRDFWINLCENENVLISRASWKRKSSNARNCVCNFAQSLQILGQKLGHFSRFLWRYHTLFTPRSTTMFSCVLWLWLLSISTISCLLFIVILHDDDFPYYFRCSWFGTEQRCILHIFFLPPINNNFKFWIILEFCVVFYSSFLFTSSTIIFTTSTCSLITFLLLTRVPKDLQLWNSWYQVINQFSNITCTFVCEMCSISFPFCIFWRLNLSSFLIWYGTPN